MGGLRALLFWSASTLDGRCLGAASMSAKALLAGQAKDLIIRMGLGLSLRSGARGCSAEAVGQWKAVCVEQTTDHAGCIVDLMKAHHPGRQHFAASILDLPAIPMPL